MSIFLFADFDLILQPPNQEDTAPSFGWLSVGLVVASATGVVGPGPGRWLLAPAVILHVV